MAQDATPSTPTTVADLANASALVETTANVRQALDDGSSAVVSKETELATAITQKILGGIVGTTTNRLLKSKTVSSGSSAGSLQASGITCDGSNNLSGIGNIDLTGNVVTSAGSYYVSANGTGFGPTGALLTLGNAYNLYGYNSTSLAYVPMATVTTGNPPTLNLISTASKGGSQIATLSGVEVFTNKTITYTAGTTSAAPITLAAGSNLTTAAAGKLEFDGTCFYETAAASSRQVVDTEQAICLSANYTLDATTTGAQKAFDASTNGALTVQGSTTYLFEGLYLITNTGTNSHFWQIALGGTATFTSAQITAIGQSSTGAALFGTIGVTHTTTVGTLFAVSAASTSATENMTVLLRGVMRINAGGTVIPQVAVNAATGGAATMLANSYFRVWPIGSNAVTSVGNWS